MRYVPAPGIGATQEVMNIKNHEGVVVVRRKN